MTHYVTGAGRHNSNRTVVLWQLSDAPLAEIHAWRRETTANLMNSGVENISGAGGKLPLTKGLMKMPRELMLPLLWEGKFHTFASDLQNVGRVWVVGSMMFKTTILSGRLHLLL